MWRQTASPAHPTRVQLPPEWQHTYRTAAPVQGKNRLLAALPAGVHARLAPDLELVHLETGFVLYESGEQLQHVYFPVDCIVSLRCELQEGAGLEIAVAGNESMIGIALAMGGLTRTNRAVACSAGFALRIKAEAFMLEFERGGVLQDKVLHYLQALITQTAQTTVCNRHHSLDQQLCRWLLLRLDRLPSNSLLITQELIAVMLGVRRESVTEAAGKLQAAGIIHYRRGRITVLDRPGLEALACECYAVVDREYTRLLPQSAAA